MFRVYLLMAADLPAEPLKQKETIVIDELWELVGVDFCHLRTETARSRQLF